MSSDWPVLPLEDCLDALIDYRGKTPEKTDSGIPLITAKIIKSGRIETPTEFIAVDNYDAWMRRGIPRAGDVVLTVEAPLGEVAQLGSEKVALAQRVVTLRGKTGLLDSTYLLYLLQSEELQDQLRFRATGTTVLGIKQSELRKISIKVPPVDVQQAAAAALKALDDRITLLRETNATLEAIAQALFKSWFVDFDPVRAKIEGRAPEGMDEATATLFPAALEETELGLVPEGWCVGSILDIAKLLSGGTPKTDRSEYWGGDILWASAKDVSQASDSVLLTTERTITELGLNGSSTKLIPAYATAVVARGATTGRLVMFGKEMAMNQTCYALVSRQNTPTVLSLQLRREMGRLVNAAHGSVFDTITTTTFEKFVCLLPPEATCTQLEQITRPMFDKVIANVAQAQLLSQLRNALLPHLISGQLRLPEAKAHLEAQLT